MAAADQTSYPIKSKYTEDWPTSLSTDPIMPSRVATRVIIIIAFQGAIRDFFTISSLHCEPSQTRTLKWSWCNHVKTMCNTSSTYHVQCVVLCATWYEDTYQLLRLTELKLHLFELYFTGWTIKPMDEGRIPEHPEKTLGYELQKMPHTTAWRFKPQAKLEPAQEHW